MRNDLNEPSHMSKTLLIQNNITIDCILCKNVQCMIKQCDTEWLKVMNEKNNQIVFRKGQYVFLEGNPVFGIYFIQQGKVKITSSSLSGKKQIVRLATDGHILGHRGYTGETYPVEASTLEDSRICFFDNQTLYDAFIANSRFAFAGMMFYSKELRKSEQRTKFFAQMTVEEKIIFALLYIASTFGLNEKDKALNAILSRQEISEIAGTNSEQVSRSLASLERQNIIHIHGKKILLVNYEALKNSISRYKITLF